MTSPVVSNYRGRAAASVHGGSGYWRMMRAAVAAAQSRRSGEVLPALPWHRAAEWARCPAGKCLMHLHSCSTQHHLYAGMLVLRMLPCAEQLGSHQSSSFACAPRHKKGVVEQPTAASHSQVPSHILWSGPPWRDSFAADATYAPLHTRDVCCRVVPGQWGRLSASGAPHSCRAGGEPQSGTACAGHLCSRRAGV